jgi:hypothetical protein
MVKTLPWQRRAGQKPEQRGKDRAIHLLTNGKRGEYLLIGFQSFHCHHQENAMHNASSFASASYSQSICQTTSYIGSAASHGSCRDDEGVPAFTDELMPLLQLPVMPGYVGQAASSQLTSVSTIVGVGYTSSGSNGASTDSLMQLLQGLESEIAQLAGELNRAAKQGPANAGGTAAPASGLHGDYATLYSEAIADVQDNTSFDLKLPSGESLSGSFSWSELEVAGDNSLFTPGDPSAPDAGKQAFENSLEQFLQLAQSDSGSGSAAGQIANYTTNTSFNGSNSAMAWSGSFSLAPADAIPKS